VLDWQGILLWKGKTSSKPLSRKNGVFKKRHFLGESMFHRIIALVEMEMLPFL
jgi:hypothetical protein